VAGGGGVETKTAREHLVKLFWTGFGVVVFGITIAASTKPSVKASRFGDVTASGSQGAYDMGLVTVGVVPRS
jgi:hypothetical protein